MAKNHRKPKDINQTTEAKRPRGQVISDRYFPSAQLDDLATTQDPALLDKGDPLSRINASPAGTGEDAVLGEGGRISLDCAV